MKFSRIIILLVIVSLCWLSPVFADSESHTAGTGAGAGWTDPTNAQGAEDSLCATYAGTGQALLTVSNFGFTSIQTTDVVDSINILFHGRGASSGIAVRDIEYALTKQGLVNDGTLWHDIPLGASGGTCAAAVDVTSYGHGLHGTTWTGTQIRATEFGARIADDDATSNGLSIDAVTITVWYHTPATNSFSFIDSTWHSFTVRNAPDSGDVGIDSTKYWLGTSSTFANAWPLKSKLTYSAVDTIKVDNLNQNQTWYVWARIYNGGTLQDSDSLAVHVLNTSFDPKSPDYWNYIEDDTIHAIQAYGADYRYNYDSSGTWAEIHPIWVKDGTQARYHIHDGYYTAHVDSTAHVNVRLDTDTTDYILDITFSGIKWFNVNDSTMDSTCFGGNISNDSIEIKYDTLIYHGFHYMTDFYFIYGRSGLSMMYDFKHAARDSLDIQFTNWWGDGDSMWLAAVIKIDSLDHSCAFHDNGVGFNPFQAAGYDVTGIVTLEDTVSDNGSTEITIPMDSPTGDSSFETSSVFRRFTDAGSGNIGFMEAVDYKQWQDSSATGSIRFFASYTYIGSSYLFDTYLSGASQTTNYGTATSLNMLNGTSTANKRHTLIKFDISQIPTSATIESTILSMYPTSVQYPTKNYYGIEQIDTSWVEDQTTWLIRQTGQNWGTAGGDFIACGNDTTFCDTSTGLVRNVRSGYIYGGASDPLTTWFQSWVGSPTIAHGIYLNWCTAEYSSQFGRMNSSEASGANGPQLYVKYTSPLTYRGQVITIGGD